MKLNTEKLHNQTLTMLMELFQLDQPDLDFGIYRIMQVRQNEITDFLDKDLLTTIDTVLDNVK